jgi:hypothetical protein
MPLAIGKFLMPICMLKKERGREKMERGAFAN